jgi:hypothetical protein
MGCRLALLLHPPLGAVRVSLDPMCFLGIRRADSRWVVRCDHQNASSGRSLVVGRDPDPGFLELASVKRRGSLRGARDVTLLVDLP